MPLDIFHQIENDTLVLSDYHLSDALAQGLRRACETQPRLFQKIIVNNCGLTDQGLVDVLEGCLALRVVRSIVLRNTIVGEKAGKVLVKNVERPLPLNVEELKLESCQVPIQPLTELLEALP